MGNFGVGFVNLRSPEGYTERGVLLAPVRVDPTGTTSQPVTVEPDNAVGGTLVSVAYQQLSAVAYSDIVAVDVAAELLLLVNSTAVMRTVFVRTKEGTPSVIFDGFELPPGVFGFPMYGAKFTSGLEWKAGGTGVYGAFKGYKAP